MSQLITTQESTPYLIGQLMLQSAELGPFTQLYMAWRGARYLLSGVTASWAQQTIAAVDSGERTTKCIARMTATMVCVRRTASCGLQHVAAASTQGEA